MAGMSFGTGGDPMGMEPIDTKNLDRYGHAPLEWSRPRDLLPSALTEMETVVYLGTASPQGRPHSAGVGAFHHEGDLYFVSGPGTRKSRNVEANPACTLSVRLPGIDMVFEGDAHRVTDPEVVKEVAAIAQAGGWPAEADGDALTAPYSAPSAGPPPWYVYRITARSAVGVATQEPHGATKWTFAR